MKLRHIAGRLKGRRLDAALTGCDLFVGPNGSGKSSHLLLVATGLRGLATAPTDPVREYLGPNRDGESVLSWDDGRTLRRDLGPEKGKAVIAADTLAADIAGPHVVRWDLADFTRTTDSARAKLLERVCSVSGSAGEWTSDRIRGRLTEWSNSYTRGIADALVAFAPLDVDGAGDLDAGRWIATALAWVGPVYTDLNAAAKQAAQTAAGMAEERANAPKLSGSLDEARQAVARHEADASAARSQLAAAKATGTARADHEREGDRAAAAVADAEQAVKDAEGAVNDARSKAEQLDNETPHNAYGAAQVSAGEAMNVVAVRVVERRDAHTRWQSALEAKSATNSKRQTLQALVEHAGACRHCQGADPLALAEAIGHAEEAADDAAANEGLALLALKRADHALAAAHTERDRMLAGAQAAKDEQFDAERKLEAAGKRVADARVAHTNAVTRHSRALADLTAWQERPIPPEPVDTSLAEAQLSAATEALATAKGQVEALVRQQEREAAMQRAVVTREEAAARFEAVKALGAALKRLQAEIARDAYGPITSEANTLLTEAGSDLQVEFHDEADFGARRGDVYIHFAALSDAERATVGASLCYAFARLTKAPWRAVVLDGMEAIDGAHVEGLIRALAAAVADGRLDNVIGASVGWPPVGDGVSIHSTGENARPQLALVSQ